MLNSLQYSIAWPYQQIRPPSPSPQLPITNPPPSCPISMSKQFKCQRQKANKPPRNNPHHPSPLLSTFPILHHCQPATQFEFPDTDDVEEIAERHKHATPTKVKELHINDGAWEYETLMITFTNSVYRAHRTQNTDDILMLVDIEKFVIFKRKSPLDIPLLSHLDGVRSGYV